MNHDPSVLKAIFDTLEGTLIREGDQHERAVPMGDGLRVVARRATEDFRNADNDKYFRQMVHVVFYAGMKAATVTKALDAIDKHFPSYTVAAGYGASEIAAIMNDTSMIRNRRKIEACIHNAKKFVEICSKRSFVEYLGSFASDKSRWKAIKEFKFMGKITSFHYLMEIGYPLLKPDRVVSRIFSRLGLVNGLPEPILHPNPTKFSEDQLWQIVEVGERIADATGHAIRYVDLVFVTYGQVKGQDPEGLSQGICLDNKPKCYLCGLRDECQYSPKTVSPL
jgi:DNA-3-methyladenine glycosylase I